MFKNLIGTSLCVLAASTLVLGCKGQPAPDKAPAAEAKAEAAKPAAPAAAPATAPAPAPKAVPAPAAPGKTYGSPEEVFAAAKAAIAAKDFGTFCDCIEPEAQKAMALGMVMVLGFLTMMDQGIKPRIDALLKKHEVPEMTPDKTKSQEEAFKELADKIKNPRGLIADAMALMEAAMDEQIKAGKAKKGQKQDPVFGELADLKVTGDKATAVMKSADGKSKPMSFAKIGGSWYLAPDLGM